MKAKQFIVASALLSLTSAEIVAQPAQPTVQVCLRAYNEGARQARYLVTINWAGTSQEQIQRFDIAAEDASGDVWPQLRDERLQPRARPSTEFIVVSDVSRYPLQFFLIGFEGGARDRFDAACADGFCSLRLPAEGVTEIGQGAAIASVQQAPPCP